MKTGIASILAIFTVLSILFVANFETITKSSGEKYITSDEKYVIKKWESTYINSAGQKAKDNKISLSDDYWEGGKFSF